MDYLAIVAIYNACRRAERAANLNRHFPLDDGDTAEREPGVIASVPKVPPSEIVNPLKLLAQLKEEFVADQRFPEAAATREAMDAVRELADLKQQYDHMQREAMAVAGEHEKLRLQMEVEDAARDARPAAEDVPSGRIVYVPVAMELPMTLDSKAMLVQAVNQYACPNEHIIGGLAINANGLLNWINDRLRELFAEHGVESELADARAAADGYRVACERADAELKCARAERDSYRRAADAMRAKLDAMPPTSQPPAVGDVAKLGEIH